MTEPQQQQATIGTTTTRALFNAIEAAATRVETATHHDAGETWARTAEALARAVESICDAGRDH